MDRRILSILVVLGFVMPVFAVGLNGEFKANIGKNGQDVNLSANVSNGEINASISISSGGLNETFEEIQKEIHPVAVNRSENVCALQIKDLAKIVRRARMENMIAVGKALDKIRAEVMLAGMNATIEKAKEYGANASELEELRNTYIQVIEDLANSQTREEHRQNAMLIKQIVREFREKAHNISELEEHADEVIAAVKEAMKQVREQEKTRLEENWERAKEVGLAVFDLHICLAESKINRFYNLGFNTTLAEEKLEEIKDLRDDLEAAYDSMNGSQVAMVKVEIAKKWGEFHRAFIRIERKVIIYKYAMARKKMEAAINKLEEHGVNATQLKEKLKLVDQKVKQLNETDKSLAEFNKEYNKINKKIIELAKEKVGVA